MMDAHFVPQIGDTWTVDGRKVTIRQDGERVVVRCDRGHAWAEAEMSIHVWLMLSDGARREYLRVVARRASRPHELPAPPDKQEQAHREWWPVASDGE